MSTAKATRKLRSPLKWHGGKSYLARRINALMPYRKTYVEPFAGGLSVLLNRPRAEREVVGDLNADLINFWDRLQDPSDVVSALTKTVSYDEATFESARHWLSSIYPSTRAVGFVVRNRFSRGGLGKSFAWSDRLRGGQPGDVNAWDTIREDLPAIAQRIRKVEFHSCFADQLIRSNDSPDTLFYLDPPYLHETRTARKAYAFEMSRDDHERLLVQVQTLKGKVFLSGYRSALYDEALAGWTRHEFDMPNHSGQGKSKQRRIECLWESPSKETA